ncbi:MAG: hypothetical protein N3E45_17075 [Oscillatoriaceae bacterium SKW80]|nr:hypothetical protein [Oscillatoriaceae bacterium SKW80]HIK27972.1 hypothetical protein [Oscillatoriaceae cyanobacterium M7585_C2015_266]
MNYQQVTEKLTQLGLDWHNPRIKAFISDVSDRTGRQHTPATLPTKALTRIYEFLEIYDQININLRKTKCSWGDKWIQTFFSQHSTKDNNGNPTNRLSMDKWKLLEQYTNEDFIAF